MELVENDIKYRMCDGLALRLDCGFAHSNLNYMRKYYLVSQKIQTSGFFGKGQTLSGFLTWIAWIDEIVEAATWYDSLVAA